MCYVKNICIVSIINYINEFQNDRSVAIAYIYCNYQQHAEQMAEKLLASLLRQFCQGDMGVPKDMQSLHG